MKYVIYKQIIKAISNDTELAASPQSIFGKDDNIIITDRYAATYSSFAKESRQIWLEILRDLCTVFI